MGFSYTVIWHLVFLPNTNRYMVSKNYFDLIEVICFHAVICFK